MTDPLESNPSDDAEEAYDRFLEAALRGDVPLDGESLVPPDDAPADIREAVRGLRRVMRGDDGAREALPSVAGLPFNRLGEFRLIREIGRGGMGVVYLAEQESLGRMAAVKVLRPEQSGGVAEARFRREMTTVATLQHDHIVTVYASGMDDDVAWLAMEFLPGNGLDERILAARNEADGLSVQGVVSWGVQIASALSAAHEAGFVHRDVKPSNIRIRNDERAVLLDFGLARRIDSNTLTATGSFTGSPFYVSPEQIQARRREVTYASDIYSLGVSLYEALTGRVPFDSEDPARLFHQVLSEEPLPPRKIRPGIPADLETVILHAIEKVPDQRYSSAAAFASDLDAVLGLKPIAARPATVAVRMKRTVKRHRGIAAFVSLVLLVFLAVTMVRLHDQSERDHLFFGHLADADVARSRGDHEAGLASIDRALGVRPDEPGAKLARREAVEEMRRAGAEKEVLNARAGLGRLAHLARSRADLEGRVRASRSEERLRWLPHEERERYDRDRRELAEVTERFDEERLRVDHAISAANGKIDAERISEVRAEFYMALWRIASARGDHRSAGDLEKLVAEHDRSGVFLERIRAGGALRLVTEPAGLEVHLFRYRRHSDVVPGGDARLVPVAVSGDAPPVRPGSVVLRAVSDVAPVKAGDLIVEVEGRPVTGHFIADSKGLREEVLISVGEKKTDHADYLRMEPYERDMAFGGSGVASLPPVEIVFDRAGERVSHRLRWIADLGWRIVDVPEAIRRYGSLKGMVYRGGELIEMNLPRDLHTRMTAAPMFVGPTTSVGTTPISGVELSAGSYLALLRTSDGNQLRVPFVISRDESTEIEMKLPPVGNLAGMAFVPAGPFVSGGDPDAVFGGQRLEPFVGDFWIQDVEVSANDYAYFLNDPATREAIAGGDELLVPRYTDPLRADPAWAVGKGGLFRPPGRGQLPASSVTWHAAVAYAAWLNGMVSDDAKFVYDLPTELEWEKAARGVDGRAYPFGDEFDPTWVRGRYSRVVPATERGNAYPVDESPYGVFDLAGNLFEWTGDSYLGRSKAIRGGSWGLTGNDAFRVAKRGGELPDVQRNQAGFRLVLRPIEGK